MTNLNIRASEKGAEFLQHASLSLSAVNPTSPIPSLKLLSEVYTNTVMRRDDAEAASKYVDLHTRLAQPKENEILRMYWNAVAPEAKVHIAVRGQIAAEAALRHDILGTRTGEYTEAMNGYKALGRKALSEITGQSPI
jgi:hypothetical protein